MGGPQLAVIVALQARQVLAEYERTLAMSTLSPGTCRAYASRVGGYLRWLSGADVGGSDLGPGDPLRNDTTARRAVDEYRSWLESEHRARPTTVNATLTAIDHLHAHLGLDDVGSSRVEQPAASQPALSPGELAGFHDAVTRRPGVRDRAIALVLVDTGVLASELVALDVPDLHWHPARVAIRSEDLAKRRELPMTSESRATIRAWLKERQQWTGTPALFVNRRGERLSTRWVTEIVVAIGQAAELDRAITPALLRRSFASHRLERGDDPHRVAELMGHKRLQTTNAYRV